MTAGVTPDPIPNSVVKPRRADGTNPARDWESRTALRFYFHLLDHEEYNTLGEIAQLDRDGCFLPANQAEAAMAIVQVGPWTIDADVSATRKVYASTPSPGSPRDCFCQGCRNFLRLSDHALIPAFHRLLIALGIDPHKAAEIFEVTPPDHGAIVYGGWFHCLGSILSGPAPWPETRWFRLNQDWTLTVRYDDELAIYGFAHAHLVEVEFRARLPWVLAERVEWVEWACG